MIKTRSLLVLLALGIAVAGVVGLVIPARDAAQDWQERKPLFQQAALRAEPVILAIGAYTSAVGHPPTALADIGPEHLEAVPATGLEECGSFEYRSLTHKQGSIVWYDLGSRQGQPHSGKSRYSDGDPDHAILVFSLDSQGKITNALIDRMPVKRGDGGNDTILYMDVDGTTGITHATQGLNNTVLFDGLNFHVRFSPRR